MVSQSSPPVGDSPPRLTQLRRVTAELASAMDLDAVIEVVVAHAKEAVGAAIATMWLLEDPETLVVAGTRGGTTAVADQWSRCSIHDDLPVSRAVRTGGLVVVSGTAELRRSFPTLPAWPDERSVISMPIRAGNDTLGVVGLVFGRPIDPDDRELEFLGLFADTCGQAIVRVRAVAEASVRAGELAFLADAAVELASSLDYRVTLTNVARLAVGTLADWCAVEMLDDGVLRTVAVAHIDPGKADAARRLRRLYPQDPTAETGPWHAIRTGTSELQPVITDEMFVGSARDDEHLELMRLLNGNSAMFVPLIARGRVIGSITLVSSNKHRSYGKSDLAVAEDLARRAALAIDNSELHSQTLQVALQLQRAVMPDILADIPGWEIASVYQPSGRTEVGGDFYDMVALPDGLIVVVLGDVMGRGVAAAAAMAQMRAAIRAYVSTGPDPEVVVDKLDRMFALYKIPQLVTLVYGVLNPVTGVLRYSNAGNLPPILIDPDDGPHLLDELVQPPLGVQSAVPRAARVAVIKPGGTLLLYSDGLVERRDEDLDRALTRLSSTAALLNDGELRVALGRLVKHIQDDSRDDDVAALALRRR